MLAEVARTQDNDDKLVSNLKEIIQKSIKAEREVMHKLHQELSKQIKNALKEHKYKFHKQLHESSEKIRRLEVESQKHKLDIKSCLKGEGELKQLPKEFYKRVGACNKEILIKSKTIAANEKKTVAEALDVIKNLNADLKACEKSEESLKCQTKVAIEITQASHQEPAKIKKIIDEAVPALLHLVPVVVKCSNTEAHEMLVRGGKIAKGIETCIREKFHPHLEV